MEQYECATQGCYRQAGACGHCADHCTGEEFKNNDDETTKEN